MDFTNFAHAHLEALEVLGVIVFAAIVYVLFFRSSSVQPAPQPSPTPIPKPKPCPVPPIKEPEEPEKDKTDDKSSMQVEHHDDGIFVRKPGTTAPENAPQPKAVVKHTEEGVLIKHPEKGGKVNGS